MRFLSLSGVVFAFSLSTSLVQAVPSTGHFHRVKEIGHAHGVKETGHAHRVKESIDHPVGWVKQALAPANLILELRIGLPQPNFHVLESHLYQVSDPDHERYGAYLSKEEVEALVAPHPDSVDMVNQWLGSHGFNECDMVRSPAKDWVTIKLPVNLAEKMLDATFHIWRHSDSGETAIRTTTYSLPHNLHPHIDLIQPTTLFTRLKSQTWRWSDAQPPSTEFSTEGTIISKTSGTTVDAACNTNISVTCLKQLYNMVGYNSSATNGNHIGITEYLNQYVNNEDLQLFLKDQRPDAINASYKFVSIKGGLNNQSVAVAGAEADLDIQYAFGLMYPTPVTLYSTGGSPPFTPIPVIPNNTNEPYVDWLDYMLSHPNPPQTISTSYGDAESSVPLSYAQRACNGFAQLGARGVSLLFASGDSGVGDGNPDPATQQCFSDTGKNTTRFFATFPSSCPFVTSVGATILIHEVAANFSGGGFSDYFSRPTYQDAAVKKYFDQVPTDLYHGLFNRSGRAFPDIAAQGMHYRIFYKGQAHRIGGTSASCPTVASIISLLNDARISNGKPPLGFLNPLLYSKLAGALNDITSGNNPGCGTPGFNATKGWDPVTGLGTPNFEKLKDIVLKL